MMMIRRRLVLRPVKSSAILAIAVLSGFTAGWWAHPTGSSAAPAASAYSAFVGKWIHHGGILTVDGSGHGFYTGRIYTTCDANHSTACDMLLGHYIYDGDFVSFYLSHHTGAAATGNVSNSALSWRVGAAATLTLKGNDLVQLVAPGLDLTFCGPQAPSGRCGA